jgi:hypothetical protein
MTTFRFCPLQEPLRPAHPSDIGKAFLLSCFERHSEGTLVLGPQCDCPAFACQAPTFFPRMMRASQWSRPEVQQEGEDRSTSMAESETSDGSGRRAATYLPRCSRAFRSFWNCRNSGCGCRSTSYEQTSGGECWLILGALGRLEHVGFSLLRRSARGSVIQDTRRNGGVFREVSRLCQTR